MIVLLGAFMELLTVRMGGVSDSLLALGTSSSPELF